MTRTVQPDVLFGNLRLPPDAPLLYSNAILGIPRDPQLILLGQINHQDIHVLALLDLLDLPVLQGGQEGKVTLTPFPSTKSYWLRVTKHQVVRWKYMNGFIDIQIQEPLDSSYIESISGTLDAAQREQLKRLVLLPKP